MDTINILLFLIIVQKYCTKIVPKIVTKFLQIVPQIIPLDLPSTLHACISRKCTAEKCILSAPLSQKVFKQTLHCTRFFPVIKSIFRY